MHSAAHRSDAAARRRRGTAAWLAATATATATAIAIVALALSGPALAASVAPQASAPGTAAGLTTQGIIMKDGEICDPIRHIGC
jgi:hypothetical protein